MPTKNSSNSEVIVFDEKGNILNETPERQQPEKLEKDPDATQMFETHQLAGGKIKSTWYVMLTSKQRIFLLAILLASFFVLAALIKDQVARSNKKYNEAIQSRTARGCKYPTMVIQGSKEGYAVDPDEGCSPQ